MRLFEIVLVLLLAGIAVLVLLGLPKRLTQIVCWASLLVFLIHVVFEGPHWQMLPAYLGLIIAAPLALLLSRSERRHSRVFAAVSASFVLLLCGFSVLASMAFPLFSIPKPTGPYQVGTRILYLTDESRHESAVADPRVKRQVVVQVWYPAEPSKNRFAIYRLWKETSLFNSYESVIRTNSRLDAPVQKDGAPFPVLIFNHGWKGRRTLATYLTEDLASHGYVVASIDHPYVAARVALPDGRIAEGADKPIFYDPNISTAEEVQREWNAELDVWTADDLFVLNSLQEANVDPKSPWYQRLNTLDVGVFGHSFGGPASLQASGSDPRIKSSINIDGWTFGGLRYRDSDKPVMFIYGDLDSRRIDDPSLSGPPKNVEDQLAQSDNANILRSVTKYGGYMLNVKDTNHLDFTDQGLVTSVKFLRDRAFTGPIQPAEIEAIMRAYVLAFFDKTLRGKNSPLLEPHHQPPFPEVTYREWVPGETNETGSPVSGVPTNR